jgi:hypothetical protein
VGTCHSLPTCYLEKLGKVVLHDEHTHSNPLPTPAIHTVPPPLISTSLSPHITPCRLLWRTHAIYSLYRWRRLTPHSSPQSLVSHRDRDILAGSTPLERPRRICQNSIPSCLGLVRTPRLGCRRSPAYDRHQCPEVRPKYHDIVDPADNVKLASTAGASLSSIHSTLYFSWIFVHSLLVQWTMLQP